MNEADEYFLKHGGNEADEYFLEHGGRILLYDGLKTIELRTEGDDHTRYQWTRIGGRLLNRVLNDGDDEQKIHWRIASRVEVDDMRRDRWSVGRHPVLDMLGM